jgi:dihydrolipoamide dehydrogenase
MTLKELFNFRILVIKIVDAEILNTTLTVIGGGPGGYSAALRGAQIGADVILIEKEKLGGICLNIGCIPSKLFLYTTGILKQVDNAVKAGTVRGISHLDIKHLLNHKNSLINDMVTELEKLLKRNRIKVVYGHGRLSSVGIVEVDRKKRPLKINSKAIIVATGSSPSIPSIPGLLHADTTDYLTDIKRVPTSIVIIGGGPEGVEFATIFRDMGTDVTVVEAMDHLLPFEDEEVGKVLEKVLRESGVNVFVKAIVLEISESDGVKTVSIQQNEDKKKLATEIVVVAMGRKPNIENIGLDALSISTSNGLIQVDQNMATNIKGIFAVGDVVGGGLAHVASTQGTVAAENALGLDTVYDDLVIPRCIYSRPQVATVGLNEKTAKSKGFDVRIGKSKMNKNIKSLIIGETQGFAKILVESKSEKVLGVQIIGEYASEVISEAALAIKLGATAKDISDIIHPYPTFSEALSEAAREIEIS